ncbi:MAG: D-Ala-D-Ala carboxypeptidase family metallohydrolase [Alistipes senegalensis]|nr:D-Ala-D-Ala carboxypeptidase family metallohydrolase [Bacteroides cellulosilyticus]MCM1351535.1 D-Ala-D-Ala carboxypeptidase family metallohydrolase [Alistipes senegalensis]
MNYFTLTECIRSATAVAKGIDNTPNAEHEAHIVESVETLIDPLREAWGACCRTNGWGKGGIVISSGYRSPQLNKEVNGSPASAHCCGYAFDLIPANRRMAEFKRFCRSFLANRPFDQLISEQETGKGVPRWVHIGYKHPDGRQRRQYLSMIEGQYVPMTV